MSRSYKKTPIGGNACAESDKWGKQKANRQHRHAVRQRLAEQRYDKVEVTDRNEFMGPWSFPKDGKHYFDIEKCPEGMRK